VPLNLSELSRWPCVLEFVVSLLFSLCFVCVRLCPWEYRKGCYFVKCAPFCCTWRRWTVNEYDTAVSILVCFLCKMAFTLVEVDIVLWFTTPCGWVKAFQRSILPSSLNIDVNTGSVRQLKPSGETHYTSFSFAKREFIASDFFLRVFVTNLQQSISNYVHTTVLRTVS
jgi:hypothetical protein